MTQIANFLKTMFCSRGILSLVLESNAWFNCWLNCKIPRNLFASHYFLIIKYLGSWGYANFGTCMAIKNMPVIFSPRCITAAYYCKFSSLVLLVFEEFPIRFANSNSIRIAGEPVWNPEKADVYPQYFMNLSFCRLFKAFYFQFFSRLDKNFAIDYVVSKTIFWTLDCHGWQNSVLIRNWSTDFCFY